MLRLIGIEANAAKHLGLAKSYSAGLGNRSCAEIDEADLEMVKMQIDEWRRNASHSASHGSRLDRIEAMLEAMLKSTPVSEVRATSAGSASKGLFTRGRPPTRRNVKVGDVYVFKTKNGGKIVATVSQLSGNKAVCQYLLKEPAVVISTHTLLDKYTLKSSKEDL